jgi:hypothetical protein
MAETARAAVAGRNQIVVWRAQPGPQTALITCPIEEIFFGGARGGGKTYGIVGDWLQHNRVYGKNTAGLVVRRTRTQLKDFIEKATAIIEPIGGRWKDQAKLFRMPNGAPLHCAFLERDADAENYQGWGMTRVYGEEIGNFPSYVPLAKLKAAMRSGGGIPVGERHTGNPGGPGHTWVKARYIDPSPLGWTVVSDTFHYQGKDYTGERIFIPSKVSDNLLLSANDPNYVRRIMQSGNEALVKAWLDGDWSVIAGAYFPEFSTELHVVSPCELPAHWVRFRSCDWGSAAPFCVLWWAVSDGSLPQFARGALICYREWYGCDEEALRQGRANVGLKLTAEEVAEGILRREGARTRDEGAHKAGTGGERIDMSVIDPAAFARNGGPSIAEKMALAGVHFHAADNSRAGNRGSMSGWDSVRQRLKGEPDGDDGRPLILFFSTCPHVIRTLPALQHDPTHPEDADTDGEDHAPDTVRYGCLARPWVRNAPTPPDARILAVSIGTQSRITINDVLKARRRKRLGG